MKAIFQESENHWAFQPVQNPEIPKSGSKSAIDAFVEQRLQEKSLDFAKPANRQTMIHRLYQDLIGLKPTFNQVNAFVNDQTPNAYTKIVDQLLNSPRFGERWGRHWLDVARYADTKGYLAGREPSAIPMLTPTRTGDQGFQQRPPLR